MATEYFYFSGEALYPKLNKADTKYDAAGIFSIGITLDEPSLADFTRSGLRLQNKPYKDSKPFVTFKRKDTQMIKDENVKFGPPNVIDKDGNKVTALVGNGSKVTAKVAVYDTRMGKGHRLETVRVDELIEFVPEKKEATDAAAPATPTRKMPF